MVKLNLDKTKVIISILAVLLIISVSYIIFDKLQDMRTQELAQSYQNGYNMGVETTLYSLLQRTNNCSLATFTLGNFTRTVVDISCINTSK